jgi:hypothetical protein
MLVTRAGIWFRALSRMAGTPSSLIVRLYVSRSGLLRSVRAITSAT